VIFHWAIIFKGYQWDRNHPVEMMMRLTLGKAWVAAKKKKKKEKWETILVPIWIPWSLTTVQKLQQSIKVSGESRASQTYIHSTARFKITGKILFLFLGMS
jgi:hypothetical protein